MTGFVAKFIGASCLVLASTMAHAGLIEDLLATPAIQALLGRLPELPALTRNCEDPGYKQRNQAFCRQAEQAAQLARMPPELRAVMSNAASAQSLRELCLAAVGTPQQNSYLCVELGKTDERFKAMSTAEQQQQIWNRQMR